MNRLILAITIAVSTLLNASTCMAQDFGQHFEESTLRLDYIFSGNREEQHIALDKLNMRTDHREKPS